VLEQRIASLEGGVAPLAVSSGQAASALAVQNLCRPGDNMFPEHVSDIADTLTARVKVSSLGPIFMLVLQLFGRQLRHPVQACRIQLRDKAGELDQA
jgi:cystathionine beta-lyase/cystathionine gamma-synthase